MSCKLEPATWSRATGQRITFFDKCHLIIAGMSNIKKYTVNQGCMSLSNYFLESGRHVARLRRRRAYAPTSNTASHDNHEEFPFLSHDAYGAPLLIIFIIFWGVVRRGVRTGSPWSGP